MTGTYILSIRLRKQQEISVGKLGAFPFNQGYYLYIGSAFGPGGLNARIKRHLQCTKKHHWHIDCLASEETIIDVWFSGDRDKHECRWVNLLEGVPALQNPIPGFGSSDCSCPSHLFYGKNKPIYSQYRELFGDMLEVWLVR